MFDIGFLELAIILVLSLLVLGPERLPKAARTVGYWFGKARRYIDSMKSQVEAEFDSAEVKRLLHNQEVQIRELQDRLNSTDDFIDQDYHNQFENKDDPNTAPEPVSRQYDIIEEDDDEWNELVEGNRKDTATEVPDKKPDEAPEVGENVADRQEGKA